jgi:mRNA interferase HigB
VTIYGEREIMKFAKRYPVSRKAMVRFLEITRAARWPHILDVKASFPATDYVNGFLVFDIGGNKYRVRARIDFEQQTIDIRNAFTHEQYNREA